MSKTLGDDAFLTAYETLCWADEAIKELSKESARYLNQARSSIHRDADSVDELHKLTLPSHIPAVIRRKLMEALGLIKNSFDQSVVAAIRAVRGDAATKGTVYFPWADSPTDLDHRLGAAKRSGRTVSNCPKIPPDLWPVLRSFEPYRTGNSYPGGNDLVREMAHIANRKHTVRLLLLPSVAGGVINVNRMTLSGPGFFGNFSWDPVKNELIFGRLPRDSECDYNAHIALHIAFDEPGFLLQKPIIYSLHMFAAKAKEVADTLSLESTRY
ncbi:MAG: hypothetical protein JNM75_02440 [Rhodospirillales bacterium]|nr:hypothetical protein [Rhodospirillales bacterium]